MPNAVELKKPEMVQVKSLVLSAVGVQLSLLSDNQKDALLIALIYKAGGMANDGTVAPPKDWL